MRWAVALVALASCDYVIGLDYHTPPVPEESREHDEDGDGLADAFDLCPHVGPNSDADSDGDAIGDDCDPRPTEKDKRYFFALIDGTDPTMRLESIGFALQSPAKDSLILGTAKIERSALVLENVESDEAHVAINLRVLETNDAMATPNFSELGIFAVHRAFLDSGTGQNEMRGDTCLVGRDVPKAPETREHFLESNQDEMDLQDARFGPAIMGVRGTVNLDRTASTLSCGFDRADLSFSLPPIAVRPMTGKIAVGTEYMATSVFWLWIVVPIRP